MTEPLTVEVLAKQLDDAREQAEAWRARYDNLVTAYRAEMAREIKLLGERADSVKDNRYATELRSIAQEHARAMKWFEQIVKEIKP